MLVYQRVPPWQNGKLQLCLMWKTVFHVTMESAGLHHDGPGAWQLRRLSAGAEKGWGLGCPNLWELCTPMAGPQNGCPNLWKKVCVFSNFFGRTCVPFKQLWIKFLIIMDGPSRSTSLKQWLIGHVATSHSPDLVFWFHLSAGRPNPLTAHTMSVVRFWKR